MDIFSQGYYNDAINNLERFLVKYKNHPQTDYAYYLLALSHYDQIVDERKDMYEILQAKKYFEFLINNYADTDYARDSKYKLEFIVEIIASKEMYLARYYVQREKWIPAINRFKTRIDPRKYNGAVLLGLNGIVVKSHGGTDAFGFSNAIGVAVSLIENSYVDEIKKKIES